jgi:hypothetical protein
MKILEQDSFILNECNKKNIIEMTKFIILTRNTIVSGFLEENSPVDMSIRTEKKLKDR